MNQPDLISVLSDEALAEIDHEISHAPYKSAVAIDALKIVQKFQGWVSDERLSALAQYLEMSDAELEGIATFYNHIYRRPVGDKVILFCNSVSCWIKNSDGLEKKISSVLKVPPGGTTDDNQYTFIPVPCLGACDKAPVMMVGEDMHYNLDDKKIEQIFYNAAKSSSEASK